MPDMSKALDALLAADMDQAPPSFEALCIRLRTDPLSCGTDGSGCLNPLRELIQWLNDEKAVNHLAVRHIGLRDLSDWAYDSNGFFSHKAGRFFRFIGVRVGQCDREVCGGWDQPIMDNVETGVIGLLATLHNGRIHFLMQAKVDAGNRDIVQIGPTVQFVPGNYSGNNKIYRPFLFEEFISPQRFIMLYESRQSEEGGRFYREDHAHRILLVPPGQELELPPGYKWFTYGQISFFLQLGDYVNSCARSILSCML